MFRFDVKTNPRGEHNFLQSECQAVRDRQMREIALEDDLLDNVLVRYAAIGPDFVMKL